MGFLGSTDAFTSSYDLCGPLFTSVIELKNLDFLAMWPSFAKRFLRNHTYTGKVTAKITESLLSLVGNYFQRRLWPCTLFLSALWIWKANKFIRSHRLWLIVFQVATFFVECIYLSNQYPWSIHCRKTSIGGWAPYFSLAGMLRSSTNTTTFLPMGGPYTPRLRLQRKAWSETCETPSYN